MYKYSLLSLTAAAFYGPLRLLCKTSSLGCWTVSCSASVRHSLPGVSGGQKPPEDVVVVISLSVLNDSINSVKSRQCFKLPLYKILKTRLWWSRGYDDIKLLAARRKQRKEWKSHVMPAHQYYHEYYYR